MKISGCVITKNEATNIERCILSYKDIADEIIVVDTGSSDNTVELASALGAKVYYFEWCNDFAAAKNCALDKASGDWIIFLDADEYFQKDSTNMLFEAIKAANENPLIHMLYVRMNNIDSVSGKLIDYHTSSRVFRSTLRYTGAIHEQLYYIEDAPGRKGLFIDSFVILHTGYSKTIIKSKHERNLPLLLEKEAAQGELPSLFYYYIATDYSALEDHIKGYEYACKTIETPSFTSDLKSCSILSRAFFLKIHAMFFIDKYTNKDILTVINDLEQTYPEHPEFKFFKASIYSRANDWDRALSSFYEALSLNTKWSNDFFGNTFGRFRVKTLSQIAQIYYLKHDKNTAFDYATLALKEDPYYKEALDVLLSIIRDQEDIEIIYLLKKLYHEDEKDLIFLLTQLQMKKIVKPYEYFYFKLDNIGEHFLNYLTHLLFKQQYSDCAEAALKAFTQSNNMYYQQIAVAATLLSQDKTLLNVNLNIFSPFYSNFMRRFFDNKEFTSFDSTERESIQAVLKLITIYSIDSTDTLEQCLRLLATQAEFHMNTLIKFLAHSNAHEAICELYEKMPNIFTSNDLHKELAMAYYLTKGFAPCITILVPLLEENPSDYIPIQILKMIGDQGEPEVKELANKLVKQYHRESVE